MFRLPTKISLTTIGSFRFRKLPSSWPLRNLCNKPHVPLSVLNSAYQEAINICNDDPNITAADAGNKAFAYLALHKEAYAYSALECFILARELDKDHKYEKDIACGIASAKSTKSSDEICYHYFAP